MKSTTLQGRIGRGSTVVPTLMGILLAGALALPVTVEAAVYVDGKRCAGDAFELPNGNFKCRLADGSVAEGAGSSGAKVTSKTPKQPGTKKPVQPEITK